MKCFGILWFREPLQPTPAFGTRMCLSPWLLARLIQGSVKKEKESGGNRGSSVMHRGFGKHTLDFSHYFQDDTTEFLQSGNVNHYGNFGGKNARSGYISLLSWLQDEMHSSYLPPPLPSSLPHQFFCKFLVQFLARCFPLEFTKEVNRKMVPQIFFFFDVDEIS